MKKLLALLLTVCLLAACLPLSASAAGSDVLTKGGNIKLTEDISLTDDVWIRKNTVLDLNGHTISGDIVYPDNDYIPQYAAFRIAQGVTFSIKNGKMSRAVIRNEGNIDLISEVDFYCPDTTSNTGKFRSWAITNSANINTITRCTFNVGAEAINNFGDITLIDNCDINATLASSDKGSGYDMGVYADSTDNDGKITLGKMRHCRIMANRYAVLAGSSSHNPAVIEDCILVGTTGVNANGSKLTIKDSLLVAQPTSYKTAAIYINAPNSKSPRVENCTLVSSTHAAGYNKRVADPVYDSNGEMIEPAKVDFPEYPLDMVNSKFYLYGDYDWQAEYNAWKMEGKPAEDEEEKPEETPAVSIDFKDVPAKAYYAPAVAWAVENNITSGTGGGKFSPAKPCSRAEAVTFLWRAAGCPEPTSSAVSFSDVKSNTYYTKAVAWAVEKGITSGTGGGKFSPDKSCSRSEIVAFLYRAEGSPAVSGGASFSDVPEKSFYTDAVAWAVANEITSGTGGGKFSPVSRCDRSQIVTFLYRYSN